MPAGSRKLRVVIDTNVFISGLNFAGKPGEVLNLIIEAAKFQPKYRFSNIKDKPYQQQSSEWMEEWLLNRPLQK